MNHAKTMLSAKAAKAYCASAIAAVSFLVPVMDDGLSLPELLGALGAALAAFQGTYWVSNAGSDYDG